MGVMFTNNPWQRMNGIKLHFLPSRFFSYKLGSRSLRPLGVEDVSYKMSTTHNGMVILDARDLKALLMVSMFRCS
jgi:hypothetical protein